MANTRVVGKRLKRGQFKSTVGEFYGTPKEVWGFRTRAAPGSPENVARGFLAANTALFELEDRLAGLEVRRVIRSIGAEHVILSQVHAGLQVHRAYVTVHIDRAGRVFLAKNRSVPARLLPAKFDGRVSKVDAVTAARRSLPKKGSHAELRQSERIWFPYRDKLAPAWKLRLTREQPRQEWIVYVNARTGSILSRYDNLSEATSGSAQVFDPSPVTALGDHAALLTATGKPRRPPPNAYSPVTLPGLDGRGFLTGEKVTTAPTGRRRVKRSDLQFLLRSHERGFEEVMVYYHVDAALRYLEKLGYRGTRAIFGARVRANVNGTRDDNSWYSPWDKLLTFGTGGDRRCRGR